MLSLVVRTLTDRCVRAAACRLSQGFRKPLFARGIGWLPAHTLALVVSAVCCDDQASVRLPAQVRQMASGVVSSHGGARGLVRGAEWQAVRRFSSVPWRRRTVLYEGLEGLHRVGGCVHVCV